MKGNNLHGFEYEFVEIVDVFYNYVDAKFLTLVKSFKYVLMVRVEEEEDEKVLKTCVPKHIKFSHQIPTFRLTKEKVGNL